MQQPFFVLVHPAALQHAAGVAPSALMAQHQQSWLVGRAVCGAHLPPNPPPRATQPSSSGADETARAGASKLMAAVKSAMARAADERQVAQVLNGLAGVLREQAYTALIVEAGKRGELAKARAVFELVPVKNTWHYSAFISALAQAGDWAGALQQLAALKELHVLTRSEALRPNNVTYAPVITACARANRLDYALHVFQDMLHAGLEPDEVTYHVVLWSCMRTCAWDQVASLLSSMHSRGQCARPTIYAAYIRELCRRQDWNAALGVFLTMQELEQPVDCAMCVELVMVLLRNGKHRMAARLLIEAAEADVLGSSECFVESVLQALLVGPQPQLAQLVHAHFAANGWTLALPLEGAGAAGAAVPAAVADAPPAHTLSHSSSSSSIETQQQEAGQPQPLLQQQQEQEQQQEQQQEQIVTVADGALTSTGVFAAVAADGGAGSQLAGTPAAQGDADGADAAPAGSMQEASAVDEAPAEPGGQQTAHSVCVRVTCSLGSGGPRSPAAAVSTSTSSSTLSELSRSPVMLSPLLTPHSSCSSPALPGPADWEPPAAWPAQSWWCQQQEAVAGASAAVSHVVGTFGDPVTAEA